MFAPLPSEFPRLQAVVQTLNPVRTVAPPPIEEIGRRLRKSYARARDDGYRSLSTGEIRKLPYAYWLPPELPLHVTDPLLVERYWSEDLPQATMDSSRRSKRWLTPLFFAYCEAFDQVDPGFIEFAANLKIALLRCEGSFPDRLKSLQQDVSFFEPGLVPRRLAERLMTSPLRLEQVFEENLLWPAFNETALGIAVFDATLEFDAQRFNDWPLIARVLDWAQRSGVPVAKTSHRVKFADALLEPWLGKKTPDIVKRTLARFFVDVYGDPRMDGNLRYHWYGVSERALTVIKIWLAGDTLRGFMRVLEQTADQIWRYRQKFWMAYYNAGHIQEAWLALGVQAQNVVRKLKVDTDRMGYGSLDSGAMSNQSVLLLKIGHLVFTEWSHSGSLRAYVDGSDGVPSLYLMHYDGQDLRAALSLDFHEGMNLNPELRHMNSQVGSWQRKARDFISQHTGIYLNDWEVL
ncbi:EH signature domain-containing protein [Rhodocyclus purpureus]|uniref:EH signature domain-containing protein n=1 Tax=Rhodocyclus purpureus TaxID=1067 RepID=UPI0019129C4A|nr:EH signature domain-containing protein [Rhodocyclus purpureus]MBK5913747.1 hypothetical protein [Rhodocyclus purpureus]